MVTLDEIMTTGISTLSPDATLLELHELMMEKHIRHVPRVCKNSVLMLIPL
jgi:CBS domain-containing protein